MTESNEWRRLQFDLPLFHLTGSFEKAFLLAFIVERTLEMRGPFALAIRGFQAWVPGEPSVGSISRALQDFEDNGWVYRDRDARPYRYIAILPRICEDIEANGYELDYYCDREELSRACDIINFPTANTTTIDTTSANEHRTTDLVPFGNRKSKEVNAVREEAMVDNANSSANRAKGTVDETEVTAGETTAVTKTEAETHERDDSTQDDGNSDGIPDSAGPTTEPDDKNDSGDSTTGSEEGSKGDLEEGEVKDDEPVDNTDTGDHSSNNSEDSTTSEERVKKDFYSYKDYTFDSATWDQIKRGKFPESENRNTLLIGAYLLGLKVKQGEEPLIASSEYGKLCGQGNRCLKYFSEKKGDGHQGFLEAMRYVGWFVSQPDGSFIAKTGYSVDLLFSPKSWRKYEMRERGKSKDAIRRNDLGSVARTDEDRKNREAKRM